MGLLQFIKKRSFDEKLEEMRAKENALLVDVRTPEEYREGRVPGSINLPLQEIDKACRVIPNRDVPVYVYCRSGARSRQAAERLKHMGYSNVVNVGGILEYKGKVEHETKL